MFIGMSTISKSSLHARPIPVNFGDSNSDTGGLLAGTPNFLRLSSWHYNFFTQARAFRLWQLVIGVFCEFSLCSLHMKCKVRSRTAN